MLTGRTGYRVTWRGKLVCQVEYWFRRWPAMATPGHFTREWRDATVTDMQAMARGDVKTKEPRFWGQVPPKAPPLPRGSNRDPEYSKPPAPPNPPPARDIRGRKR